ncbi:hypothetical protein V6N11_011995 [Hibiscus sabdariffa]|uniref:Uncharacterized protein n=1 Tax=Hibiscus sabdariffa TaxID=183260 RepID=A0ABR2PA61_9ROSI
MDSSICSSAPDPEMWIIQGTLAWRTSPVRIGESIDSLPIGWTVGAMIYFTGEVSGSSPGWPSCAKEKNKRSI